MSLPRIVGFSGSPRRPSKTRSLVETVAAEAASHRQVRLDIFDLSDAGPGLGAALQRKDLTLPAARIIDAIEQADALIIGTPVYKGAYTGLFKHAFDLVDPRALVGKPVLLTATGGGPRHALVVEHALRPLFGFFEALTVPTAIYASDADFVDGQLTEAGVLGRVSTAAQQLADLIGTEASKAETVLPQSSVSLQVVRRGAAR
jgi:FMN reductase